MLRNLLSFLFTMGSVFVLYASCKPKLTSVVDPNPQPNESETGNGSEAAGGDRNPFKPWTTQVPRSKEVRGVWLTNVDSQVLYSKKSLTEAFQKLQAMGMNTAYITVWNKGFTLFHSEVAQKYVGSKVEPNSAFQNWDMLKTATELGKKYKIDVFAWFEYGLKVPESSPIFRNNPQWFSAKQDGSRTRTDGISVAYLNPVNPQARQFLKELIVDAVKRYDLAGVQIDDHFSIWKEFGYDAQMSAAFQQSRGKQPPADFSNVEWIEFRAGQVTNLVKEIGNAIRSESPSTVFSISPNSYPWSKMEHLQDWPSWLNGGNVSEVVLQSYHKENDRFLAEFAKPSLSEAKGKVNHAVIGLLAGINARRVAAGELQGRIKETRNRGYGVSLFFYETLFNLLPPQETLETRASKVATGFEQ